MPAAPQPFWPGGTAGRNRSYREYALAASIEGVMDKIDTLRHDFDAWETTTLHADFPKGQAA